MNGKLREARRMRCWSQSEAAEKAEVDVQTYARWEKGQQAPHPHNLDLLCKAFHLSPVDLGFAQEVTSSTPQSAHNGSIMTLTAEEVATFSYVLGLGDRNMRGFDPSRRQRLRQLLGIMGIATMAPQVFAQPEPWEHLTSTMAKAEPVETLSHFETLVEACWHLLKASELELLEQVLPTLQSKLTTLALQPSEHQMAATGLASQAYQIAGILAGHRSSLDVRRKYHQQSVQYSLLTEDSNLQARALIQLASAFQYTKQPRKVLQTYQAALPFIDEVSPLLRSCVYLGLAEVSPLCQQKQEAFTYLGLAQDGFPDHPEDDPNYLSSDAGLFSLYLYQGLTYLNLNEAQNALNAFLQVEQRQIVAPERIRIEIINNLTAASIALKDMERSCTYVELGATGALALGSKKRSNEASENYQHMLEQWPHERKVKALADLFH